MSDGPPRQAVGRGFPILLVAGLVILLLGGMVFVPMWPCPTCVDLDLSVFRCELCSGNNRRIRRMSLWKRWRTIREMVSEGCKPLPLIP